MKNLIIVESPTKARTLSRFLGKEFRIEATMGHIRDLPERKIGIKTDKDFAPEYVVIPGKKEIIEKLKQESSKATKIYLATDPDREGEAIAWHVGQIIRGLDNQMTRGKAKKKSNHPIIQSSNLQRIVFHEITKSAIDHALASPREIDMDLVNAQQARRVLDRLVGYKLSPLLWFKIRRGLSAGRVQSVAVRLIVEREREREKFASEEYWRIFGAFTKEDSEEIFVAELKGKGDQNFTLSQKISLFAGDYTVLKTKITKETEAEDLIFDFGSEFFVSGIEKKEAQRQPPPPFITSTLQQAASRRLRLTSGQTMRLAQNLYEQGLITYHRTDSTHLAAEAVSQIRTYINKVYGQEYLPEKPQLYKTKTKVAQEAHEAIRPTNIQKTAKDLGKLEEKAIRLYELIWKRGLACQMAPAIVEETKVEILSENGYLFETKGQRILFEGFWKVLGVPLEENLLPPLEKGENLVSVSFGACQSFTQPPPRYTEASLVAALEKAGIGRPSTYAPIIATVQERQYVEKEEGQFLPTLLGSAVNDFLVEYFSEIVNLPFTAEMEDNLDKIANGKKAWVPVVREFYEPFNIKLNSVSKVAERVTVETEVTDEICPECGAPLVVRIGRFGKFLSCSKFPECKFTKPYLKDAGFTCPKCGAQVVVKKSKKGKTFFGCSAWPKCDFATWRKPK